MKRGATLEAVAVALRQVRHGKIGVMIRHVRRHSACDGVCCKKVGSRVTCVIRHFQLRDKIDDPKDSLLYPLVLVALGAHTY